MFLMAELHCRWIGAIVVTLHIISRGHLTQWLSKHWWLAGFACNLLERHPCTQAFYSRTTRIMILFRVVLVWRYTNNNYNKQVYLQLDRVGFTYSRAYIGLQAYKINAIKYDAT